MLSGCASFMKDLKDNSTTFWGSYHDKGYAITAKAWIGLYIDITNKGNYPIELNSFADEYIIKTKQGRFYKCNIVGDYPVKLFNIRDGGVINPGNYARVSVAMDYNIKMIDIEKITITLNYGKIVMELYPQRNL